MRRKRAPRQPTLATTIQVSSHSPPQPLSEIELDVSEPNDDPGFGTLVMSLWINELGEITRATLESEGIPEAYAKAVIVAFEKTRFSPGELHGKKVASVIRIEVLPSDSASPTTP